MLYCREGCGRTHPDSDHAKTLKSWECWRCLHAKCAPPESPSYETTGYPQGWHRRKRFEAPDGKIFERGKLVSC